MTGDWGSSASSSRAQPRDLLPFRNQRVCAEGKRCLGAASHPAMNVLQYRFLGYARNDDSAKRYQNSAALHYYLRRTNPFEFVEPTEPAESLSLNQRAARPLG